MAMRFGKYHGHFKSRADLVACYDEARVPPEEQIVYAWHSEPDYEESLMVVFVRDGQFYEVHDSHCSCYGWDEDGDLWTRRPEPTTVGALLMQSREGLPGALGQALTDMETARQFPGPPRGRALALVGGLDGEDR